MGDGERYKSETREKWSLKVCVLIHVSLILRIVKNRKKRALSA